VTAVYDADTDRDTIARRYWRRQLVLTLAATAVGFAAFQLTRLSIRREAAVDVVVLADGRILRSASKAATLWPAALGIVAVLVVSGFLLVHAWRVAAFTLRRGAH
jgi:hypothetical protein